MNFLTSPWPWFVAGPVIGMTVPVLLLLGNKNLGVSSTLRQIYSACLPADHSSMYNWKKDTWNLFFIAGIVIGGFVGGFLFSDPHTVNISDSTVRHLQSLGISQFDGLMPTELFSWQSLLSVKGFLLMVVGGFLVGFGTRYAGGCTSGHGIFGLSTLQWPSLIATMSFFLGGILFSHFVLPWILAL